ncbi:hypothetical protein PIB30_022352 [Stylosanthes scabra]|uniref:Legume lectin domain-containing protein n=1 Tax=Stylosanthes scabra TaxID=79078 RepID=A0ABU6W983_9FABA|nr:hypothetical protein [Stylosanthes scabra]
MRIHVGGDINGMVTSLFITIFLALTVSVQSSPSSELSSLSVNDNKFDKDINLSGDAHAFADGVSLTRPSQYSSGILLRNTSITFSSTTANTTDNNTTGTSLSIEFSFSISPAEVSDDSGTGFVVILIPGDFDDVFSANDSFGISQQYDKNYVAVEFDTSKDDEFNDPNANHVGIDVGSLISVAIANVSDSDIVLNNGEKLQAWIDYVANSKNLEVRLCKTGENRPKDPIVSHEMDFAKMWGNEPVFVGLSASNDADSVQVVRVYTWKVFSYGYVAEESEGGETENEGGDGEGGKGSFGTLSVLAEVIFGTVCVALIAFVVLFTWAIFFQKHEEESSFALGKMGGNRDTYERIDVSVDKQNHEEYERLSHRDEIYSPTLKTKTVCALHYPIAVSSRLTPHAATPLPSPSSASSTRELHRSLLLVHRSAP